MKLIFSDLDGTLLEHQTYSFEKARPALSKIAEKKVPLILVTSKTRAEVEIWRELLGNTHPFIVENGGAIFIPDHYFPFPLEDAVRRDGYQIIELGDHYESLVLALQKASQMSQCRVVGFQDMSLEEVSEHCQMPLDEARRAKKREYDEPFLILDVAKESGLLSAIEVMGKRWTRGGRFFHILGRNDKAESVLTLTRMFHQCDPNLTTIGLGDSYNDLPFLNVVNIPVLIYSESGEALKARLPRARLTDKPGPEGWNEILLELVSE